jgi:hypothetical protein
MCAKRTHSFYIIGAIHPQGICEILCLRYCGSELQNKANLNIYLINSYAAKDLGEKE